MTIQPCPACGGEEYFTTEDCNDRLLYCCSSSKCGFVCSARYWNHLFLGMQAAEAKRKYLIWLRSIHFGKDGSEEERMQHEKEMIITEDAYFEEVKNAGH